MLKRLFLEFEDEDEDFGQQSNLRVGVFTLSDHKRAKVQQEKTEDTLSKGANEKVQSTDKVQSGEMASDPGVVVLRPEALARDSHSDEPDDCGPPSPLAVRFINDNVLINGRSSMPHKPDKGRTSRLKIQFDDSLTRTFEYPSETSFSEDAPSPAPAANTHIG